MTTPIDTERLASASRSILRVLHAELDQIAASAVVSNDGIVIASLLSADADADRFGAMCASLLALATRAAKEVERGELRQLILDGALGPVLLTRAGNSAVLAVAAVPRASLGQLILETRKAAAKLHELRQT